MQSLFVNWRQPHENRKLTGERGSLVVSPRLTLDAASFSLSTLKEDTFVMEGFSLHFV